MGLLDQVLGQVIGGLAGQGGRQQAPAPGQGGLGDLLGQVLGGGRQAPGQQAGGGLGGGIGDLLGQVLRGGQGGPASGGAAQQAPAPSGGPLGGALGNILGGAAGKYSPLVLALLAILANKHMSSGAGGFGSVLHDMLGGGKSPAPGAGQEPEGYAGDEGQGEPPESMGAPRDRAGGYGGGFEDGQAEGEGDPRQYGGPAPGEEPRRGGGGGGFLSDIGSMLDGPGGRGAAAKGGGDLFGGGFDGLQQRFHENGRGDLMDSWVKSGPNQPAAPQDLEQALGADTVDQLSRHTGLPRDELLRQLSQALPQVVDGLTPQGRLPSQDEQRHWL